MSRESYSPYKLSMYLKCPCEYKFTYIDGLAQKFKKPRPYFTMGENVHTTLREFFKLPPKERSYKKLEYLLREIWKENRKGFTSAEEEKEYGNQALMMIKNFFKLGELEKEPLALEEQHKIELDDGTVLQGKIDRIDKEEDGLHIIDYKTGKEKDNDDENLQFLLYPLIVSRELGQKVDKISYLYLLTGKYKTKSISDKDIKNALPKILEIIEKIKVEQNFAPKISNLCKDYCDFLTICPKKFEIAPEKFKETREEAPF